MPTLRDIRKKRDEILALARTWGARNLRVFGSVLHGQADEKSDLDLLVQIDPDRSLLDHIALKQDFEDLLDCRVDLVSERALHPRLRGRILSEGIPL